MYKIIFLFLIILIVLYLMFRKNEDSYSNNTGAISGMVLFKVGKKPMEKAMVSLGKIESSGSQQRFIVEDNLETITNSDGEFSFENLKLKKYWVKAEKNGKKALRLVKLTEDTKFIEELVLYL
ncbi:MAG: carboxypeptidase-like regulatory domain-containing protein [Fusobacteriota bacterium]